MPTPTQAFLKVAARHGIDPSDAEAVQRWFNEDLPSLSSEQIEEILEELLAYDENGEDSSGVRSYPKGVPLPSLEESPVVPATLIAAVPWTGRLRGLIVRLKARIGK